MTEDKFIVENDEDEQFQIIPKKLKARGIIKCGKFIAPFFKGVSDESDNQKILVNFFTSEFEDSEDLKQIAPLCVKIKGQRKIEKSEVWDFILDTFEPEHIERFMREFYESNKFFFNRYFKKKNQNEVIEIEEGKDSGD